MKDYLEFFTASLGRVAGTEEDEHDFLTRFYEIFTGTSPEIAARFAHTDMDRQKRMLGRSLEEMMAFSRELAATEGLRRVALSHSRRERDIPPVLYDLWLDSLVATVREFDPRFTDEIELAWRVVLAPGIAYMKFRYERG